GENGRRNRLDVRATVRDLTGLGRGGTIRLARPSGGPAQLISYRVRLPGAPTNTTSHGRSNWFVPGANQHRSFGANQFHVRRRRREWWTVSRGPIRRSPSLRA